MVDIQKQTRQPPQTKAELQEMLAEAVRNTALTNRPPLCAQPADCQGSQKSALGLRDDRMKPARRDRRPASHAAKSRHRGQER